jgi:hypothetical protein
MKSHNTRLKGKIALRASHLRRPGAMSHKHCFPVGNERRALEFAVVMWTNLQLGTTMSTTRIWRLQREKQRRGFGWKPEKHAELRHVPRLLPSSLYAYQIAFGLSWPFSTGHEHYMHCELGLPNVWSMFCSGIWVALHDLCSYSPACPGVGSVQL